MGERWNQGLNTAFEKFIEKESLNRGLNPQGLTQEDMRHLAADLLMDLFSQIADGEHPTLGLQPSFLKEPVSPQR